MNLLSDIAILKNRYFVMRHGQSKANMQQIIISHPLNGTHEDYSLTDLGREQAHTSVKNSPLTEATIIYSSDFSRAKETAEIVRAALGAGKVNTTELLRERTFGDYEKTDHTNYQKVWDDDKLDADHHKNDVESVSSVLERATGLIIDLENRYEDKDILLVSHGDTLQILQTGFQKIDPTQHQQLAAPRNGRNPRNAAGRLTIYSTSVIIDENEAGSHPQFLYYCAH